VSKELTKELINVSERRQFRRVFSLVPEEDVVLFSLNGRSHFMAKLLDLSRGGALIYTADPTVGADIGGSYKLYFQSRGAMFHLEGTLVRKDLQFFAFQFLNLTPLDLAEIRAKLARMEIMAARVSVG
jgi:PilZ domain